MKRICSISVFCLVMLTTLLQAQDTIVLQTIKPSESDKIIELIALADTSSSSPTQLRYLLEALRITEKKSIPDFTFDLNYRVGKIYASEELNGRALNFFRKALNARHSEKENIPIELDLALVYSKMGHPDSAAIYYQKVLTDPKLENKYASQLSLRQKLVDAYLLNNNYKKSLDENFKLKEIIEKENDIKHLPVIYNNIGYNFNYLKDYEKAVEYFKYAESANENSKELDPAVLFTNIGIALNNLDKLNESLNYLKKARSSLGEKKAESGTYLDHLIAQIYLNNKDYFNANTSNEQAIKNALKYNQQDILVDAFQTAALIQQKLYDYELALEFYKKHLELRDSFRLEERLRQEQLIQEQILLERSEKEIRLLLVNQDVQELAIAQLKLENDKIQLENEKQASELEAIRKGEEARKANLKNVELEKERTAQELRLTAQRLEAERKDRDIFELEQKGKLSDAEIARRKAETAQKQQENELLKKDADLLKKNEEVIKLEIQKASDDLKFAKYIGGLFLLLSLIVIGGLFYSRKKNKELAVKNVEIAKNRDVIEAERNKSENLLLNILPKETAKELKEYGKATPKYYEKVTVLFTDFSGFTRLSRYMSPDDLIKELNDCFRRFDEIVSEFGLEKIKTLGDGYMAAGGIPVSNETNPVDAVKAALKINEFMIGRSKEKESQGLEYWGTRIGCHTGKVVAGVVGTSKFAYDIWGDTVNTASRMESGGQIGHVNISEDTFQLVEPFFDCSFRGEIEIKNRGKIGMYFVNELKGN